MTTLNVTVLCGSLQRPSRTLTLCESILSQLQQHVTIQSQVIEISQIGKQLGQCLSFRDLPPEMFALFEQLKKTDLLIAASPVYSASYTGLFKHFVDFMGMDALAGVPVLLAATGGSPLHGLVIDQQMRPLFAMKQGLTLPLGVYATESDFTDYKVTSPALEQRISLALERALPYLNKY